MALLILHHHLLVDIGTDLSQPSLFSVSLSGVVTIFVGLEFFLQLFNFVISLFELITHLLFSRDSLSLIIVEIFILKPQLSPQLKNLILESLQVLLMITFGNFELVF